MMINLIIIKIYLKKINNKFNFKKKGKTNPPYGGVKEQGPKCL